MPKALVEKILRSGLVDKATAALMEQWGYLEPGSAEKANEGALKNATKDTLNKLAEDLAGEVEREYVLKETHLDLERIRWPVTVSTIRNSQGDEVAKNVSAVIDRMGRYYFRAQDANPDWFVPGFVFERLNGLSETVLEKQILFINETPVCIQVSTVTNGIQTSRVIS